MKSSINDYADSCSQNNSFVISDEERSTLWKHASRRLPVNEESYEATTTTTTYKGKTYNLPYDDVVGDESTNPLGSLYFAWITKFVTTARKEQVTPESLPRMFVDYRCHNFTRVLSDRFRGMLEIRDMWNNKRGWIVEFRPQSRGQRLKAIISKSGASPYRNSKGILKSVGYFAECGGIKGPLMAEVEWLDKMEKHQPATNPKKNKMGTTNEPLLSDGWSHKAVSEISTPIPVSSSTTAPRTLSAVDAALLLDAKSHSNSSGAHSTSSILYQYRLVTALVPPHEIRLVADQTGRPIADIVSNPVIISGCTEPQFSVASTSAASGIRPVHSGILNEARATAPDSKGNAMPKDYEDVALKNNGAQFPRKPNLAWALISITIPQLIPQIPARFIADMSSLASPLILREIINFLEGDGDLPLWRGLILVVALLLTSISFSLASHQHYYLCMRGGVVARGALIGTIMEKLFTISPKEKALPDNGTGRVMTMVSSDAQRAEEIEWYLMYLWSNPVLLLVAVGELYIFVGWSAFIAVCMCLFLVPIQAFLTRRQQTTYVSQLSVTDRRLRATNELFSGIQVVKAMGWEGQFVKKILECRKEELAILRKIHHYKSLSAFINTSTPILIIVVVLVSYELSGNALSTAVVFPTIAMLSVLRTPFIVFPMTLSSLASYFASSQRIQTFLEASDIQDKRLDIKNGHHANTNSSIHIEDISTVAYIPTIYNPSNDIGSGEASTHAESKSKSPQKAPQGNSDLRDRESLALLKDDQKTTAGQEKSGTVYGGVESDKINASPGNAKGEEEARSKALSDDSNSQYILKAKTILKNLTLSIPRGKLSLVLGPTGSGKSTLLDLIIGQCDFGNSSSSAPLENDYSSSSDGGESEGPRTPHQGVWCDKDIAYVPQVPWIMNASVQGNIALFAPDIDTTMMTAAIDSCQLQTDIMKMAEGIETEIGEKGVNLSGGQKARVALARAVYANKNVYLLDDPLSALDAHVGEQIVQRCFIGQLGHTTRLLATHHAHIAEIADGCVIVMEEGSAQLFPTAKEYVASPHYERHQSIMHKQNTKSDGNSPHESPLLNVEHNNNFEVDNLMPKMALMKKTSDITSVNVPSGENKTESDPVAKTRKNLVEVEEKPMGSVPLEMYIAYIHAWGGFCIALIVGLMMVVTEAMSVSSILWITFWTDKTFPALSRETNLYIYAGCAAAGMLVPLIRWFCLYAVMRKASYVMFKELLRSVVIAPIAFFHANPLGRIMNRFSRDVDVLDQDLQITVATVFTSIMPLLSSIAMMIGTLPIVSVAVVVSFGLYYILLVYFNKAYREVRRVSSILKSPLFSIVSESIAGSQTIQAFQCAPHIFNEALWRCDRSLLASNIQWALSRWLGTRLESVTAVGIAGVALIAVLSKHYGIGQQSVGLMSLSITLGMSLMSSMNYTIRNISKLEADMNTIERISEYTKNIAHEEISKSDLKRNVPSGPVLKSGEGSINFSNVVLRYRPNLDPALCGVSFQVLPGDKVGIVGRTGSGKSTIILALLRMVDCCGGSIRIGGRDIKSGFSLRELRSLFSMVPQDPLLFEGTVRTNLDPFGEHETDVIWDALRQVGLEDLLMKESEGLEHRLTEGGCNLSTGQRQLLCLARALLKRGSEFVLMDEATANIDVESDRLIQKAVKRAFRDRTVITIAHRLNTVLDYDKVVVMDGGRVVELGRPTDLLNESGSIFSKMVEAQKSAQDKLK